MCDIQLYCLGCGLYTLRCAAEAMSIYITGPCVVRGGGSIGLRVSIGGRTYVGLVSFWMRLVLAGW